MIIYYFCNSISSYFLVIIYVSSRIIDTSFTLINSVPISKSKPFFVSRMLRFGLVVLLAASSSAQLISGLKVSLSV